MVESLATSSSRASRGGFPFSSNHVTTASSRPVDHVPVTTPPLTTRFALRVTGVRRAGGTTCASLVPGPMTHWS